MAEVKLEILDSQTLTENIGFLDNCFDNSFTLQTSLKVVKEYATEQLSESFEKKVVAKRDNSVTRKSLVASSKSILNKSVSSLSQYKIKNEVGNRSLKDWGLPLEIINKYEQRGIREMFEWQVTCLGNSKVLLDFSNLVYSAPTSAGKTLVAEILTIKTVLERQKKVIIILPFVSIVREKMFYLQDILSSSGIRVEGFMGSQSPPGGLQAVHVAICTIEKANSLVNRLLDEGNISELGAVVVDELHLLGDPHRGYILELLLTKIKYVSFKNIDTLIQIIGMSATLPNLDILAAWLEAELFITQFRPIPLEEYCLVGDKYYDRYGNNVNVIENIYNGACNVLSICLDTIKDSCSVLIFCMTKSRCENLAQSIATEFFKLGCSGNELGLMLRKQLHSESILEVLAQLKNCPVGLDHVLKNAISFGVAYHHAGLTFDERDIIEGGFKSGAIRVLVATSTLSSGVNLPARKVIIRSPVFQRQPINILTYKQMIGRAGRMGKDSKGESILVCTEAEKNVGFNLMMGTLDPVKSCIDSEDKYMRAILEMISSQMATNQIDLEFYSKCTLLYAQREDSSFKKNLLDNTLKELINYELIRVQQVNDFISYVATPLGKACLSSSMAPNDGLSLFCELQRARQCLVLETDLHLIYLVTPYSVCSQWGDIDWLHLLNLWESLTKAMKRVGELVGVQESFIIRCLRGGNKPTNVQNKLNVHKRFYTALALQDLVNEVPLSEVATKFQCARGFLQSLQQAAATFAGMVTAFCRQLGWKNMEMIISQFQDRLHFGIHAELLEIMKLPSLNGNRARSIYDAGFETISSIASADITSIENALHKAVPFQSEKEREDDDSDDIKRRKKIKNIWVTGCCGMTTKEAAVNLIMEARKYLEYEIGVTEIKWDRSNEKQEAVSINNTIHNETIVANEKSKSNAFNENRKEFKIEDNDNIIKNEILNDINQNKKPENGCKNVSNTEIVNVTEIKNEKSKSIDTNAADVSINSSKSIIVTINQKEEQKNMSPQNIKEDIGWDSLNFTEAAFDNISKLRSSDKFVSPCNLSNTQQQSSCVANRSESVKDISLFSSDGDNSSLFEDSLPLDLVTSKLTDPRNSKIVESSLDEVNLNTASLINAFKTTIIDVDEDEDIKLVYEEENKQSDNELETGFNLSEDYEVLSSEEEKAVLSHNFKSPFKRQAKNESVKDQPKCKRLKSLHRSRKSIYNCDLEMVSLEIKDQLISCYIFKKGNFFQNIELIDYCNVISIFIQAKTVANPSDLIGINVIHPGLKSNENNKSYSSRCFFEGIALFCDKNICVYLDCTFINDSNEFVSMFTQWLQKKSNLKLMGYKHYLKQFQDVLGINLPLNCEDISLVEWLIDSAESVPTINVLAKKYCGVDLSNTFVKVNMEAKVFKNLNSSESLCIKSWLVWNIASKQKQLLLEQQYNIDSISKVEVQVSRILGNCERYGVIVDKKLVSKLLIDVKNSQEILQKKAYRICGFHFNFNSSKDVAKVLGIYKGRKMSTKKSVLTAHNSTMASIIIYWRKLNSILTKTLYPLTERACIFSQNDRITPSYTTFTCTGRISMHEPNLQNVPRTFSIPAHYLALDDSRPSSHVIEFNCRNVFTAAPGCVLISADYCQLEMRILTHYCGDEVLMEIMNSDVDVFKSIAASWSCIPEEEVDDDLRQKAKQLCYGIIYGMGNKTLGLTLDVSEMEAAVFMDSFHKTYPAIRKFTSKVVDECREKGYVETLMHRRRYLADVNSSVSAKRSTAERQAVNTIIQGSAADIAKSAMCAIDNRMSGENPPRLILQMHDELIYEVPETSKSNFLKVIKQEMENTVKLKVPLPVKVKSGVSWGSLEEVK